VSAFNKRVDTPIRNVQPSPSKTLVHNSAGVVASRRDKDHFNANIPQSEGKIHLEVVKIPVGVGEKQYLATIEVPSVT